MVSESKKKWVVLVGCSIGSTILTYAITQQTDPLPTVKSYVSGAAIGSVVGGIVTLAILNFF